jgi:hypothetical protein
MGTDVCLATKSRTAHEANCRDFQTAAAFWATVLKWTVSSRRGGHDEFATLLPPDGDAYVKLQAVGEGGGMHLDLRLSDGDGPAGCSWPTVGCDGATVRLWTPLP